MKIRILSFLSLICFNSIAQLAIPSANKDMFLDQQITLESGEIAFIQNETNNTSTIIIGNGSTSPTHAVDESALIGQVLSDIPLSEVIITAGKYIAYTNNTYYVENTTSSDILQTKLRIATYQGTARPVYSVNYSYSYGELPGAEGTGSQPQIITYRDTQKGDNVIQIVLKPKTWVMFTSIQVKAIEPYSDVVNDLTKKDYSLNDSIGQFYFGNLRQWTLDEIDDNSGKDWSKWQANNSLQMNNNAIYFDTNRKFVQTTTNTTTKLTVNGYKVWEVDSGKETNPSNILQIASIDFDETDYTVALTYIHEIPNFDYTKIVVQRSIKPLEDLWETIDSSYITHDPSNNEITISEPNASSLDCSYYRLAYSGSIGALPIFEINQILKVNAITLIKDTQNDNMYRLSISNGVLRVDLYEDDEE